MIHPSYNEMIEAINEGNENGENPVIDSRYSIVMACARRARQLIDGQESLLKTKTKSPKPLSIAVEEIREGEVKITEEGFDDFAQHLQNALSEEYTFDEADGDAADSDISDEEKDENGEENEEFRSDKKQSFFVNTEKATGEEDDDN